jgi:nucleotide-binding universal stress UspA family protein
MLMQRILVGFDGSPHSEKAVSYAAKLARELHADLTLFYVVPLVYPPVDTLPIQTWADITEQHQVFAKKLIKETKAQLSLGDLDDQVVTGNPATELARAAEAPDVGLVVVGSSGKGAVARAMLGSVASRLVRTCPKPLVVVPELSPSAGSEDLDMAEEIPFSVVESLRFGWAKTLANLKPLLSLGLLSFVLGLIYEALSWSRPLSGLLILGAELLQIAISLVLVRVALKLADEEPVELRNMDGLLVGYLPYLLSLLIYAFVVSAGTLLLVVPGVVWAVGFAFAGFLVADKGLDPIEAMVESHRLTRGMKWRLFELALLLALVNLAGALALGVGLFVTIPTSFIAGAHSEARS